MLDMPSGLETFVDAHVVPFANDWDQAGRIDEAIIGKLAQQGVLGLNVPGTFGGTELPWQELLPIVRELGRGCSSVRSLVTVHGMVCASLARWGNAALQETWLPRLARGQAIGAFALSEGGVSGSDVAAIETRVRRQGDRLVLDGSKRWTTFGQRADLLLVFAREEMGASAFLVPTDLPGVEVSSLDGMFGTTASMCAAVTFREVVLTPEARVGRTGFGLSAVAASALELGRFTVGVGCLGILDAALNEALSQAKSRRSYGKRLIEHQLVAAMIARMSVDRDAAAGLCARAAALHDAQHSEAMLATWTAKYFASVAAVRAASDLVQITAARGCEKGATAQRLLRDAKVMEIIEGSSQIQEITIAEMLEATIQ